MWCRVAGSVKLLASYAPNPKNVWNLEGTHFVVSVSTAFYIDKGNNIINKNAFQQYVGHKVLSFRITQDILLHKNLWQVERNSVFQVILKRKNFTPKKWGWEKHFITRGRFMSRNASGDFDRLWTLASPICRGETAFPTNRRPGHSDQLLDQGPWSGGNYFLTFYLGGHTISNASNGSCLDLLGPFGIPLVQGVFNEHR